MSVRRRSRASSRPSILELEVPADPNTFTWPERSRKKFVQLVALQCLVSGPAPITNEHPVVVTPPEADSTTSRRRLLPQKTEREIADHFAFLAAGDGSGAACCIEEVEGRGLRFRVAMNEGVPEGVLEGLRNVLREVRRVANGDQSSSDLKSAVWANVLELEKAKVHADLLDRFARGSRPLSEQFEDALTSSTDPITDPEAHAAVQRIHDLCQRVTGSSSSSEATRDLDRLLDTCYRFRSSRSFKSGLKAVPCRRQLVQMVEKLGRYKTASNALVLAARKFPGLFAGVEVERVPTLPALDDRAAAGFKGVYIAEVAQGLTSSAETICMSRLRAVSDLSNERLASRFQELCQSAPTAHAEMQLVKFYEENAHIDRPGFIGCSKKSCFLCGLFLQLQRRFTVSKAHQNIYHTWTVPTIRCASPENAVMLDFVVEKMSRIIEDSCKKMLWEKPDDSSSPHKALMATLPALSAPPASSSGFATPRSPLSPISPGFSRPSTAASNLQNIRASARQQTPKLTQPTSSTSSSTAAGPPSKLTDSSGDSSSPEPGSPNLSSESSCTSVSEDSSKESSGPPKRQPRSSKHVEGPAAPTTATTAAAAVVERMPAIMAADAPPVPQRSASRASRDSPARPGSSRSARKRGSPVEAPKTPEQQQHQQPQAVTTTITRSQSVRASRKAAPPVTPKAPMRSASVARRPVVTPEIPARGGRARSSSAMEVRKAPVVSDAESVSPGTVSRPFGPLRRANTAPAETTAAAAATTKSAIPVPRSVSRSNRKATTHTTTTTPSPQQRSPSAIRYIRLETPGARREPETERAPSPGHITNSLRRESPISVARFETAMAMAVTSVTGSPTMVELPPYKGSSSEASGSTRTTPRGSPNVAGTRVSSRSRAQKRMSPLSVERKADAAVAVAEAAVVAPVVQAALPEQVIAVAAGLGLKKSSRASLRQSFASAATSLTETETDTTASTLSTTAAVVERPAVPASPLYTPPSPLYIPSSPSPHHTDPEDDLLTSHPVATPRGTLIIDSSEESSIPLPPKRTLTERRGRALKRVDPSSTGSTTPSKLERKRAAIDRATADAAAFVQENGFEAQRKRGMTIADVVQQSGFQAQINRGMSVRRPGGLLAGGFGPKGYYSDTETIRTRLRGGALSTISSEEAAGGTAAASSSATGVGVGRSRLGRRPQETEYTLYLAGPDHDDRTLGEKIFNGKLSDGHVGGGEMKQRVGCKLRTALRPAEKEINGMRVKEVSKSLEEMVLDIFFPDAVLRLEVVWDGNGSGSGSSGSGDVQQAA